MKSLQISVRNRFTTISDANLEEHIKRHYDQFPRSGSEVRTLQHTQLYFFLMCILFLIQNAYLITNRFQMMRAYLHAEGVVVPRRRVRETLNRINPAAAALRRSQAVARRTYYVPFPNSLWHIDGHMRLIR